MIIAKTEFQDVLQDSNSSLPERYIIQIDTVEENPDDIQRLKDWLHIKDINIKEMAFRTSGVSFIFLELNKDQYFELEMTFECQT